MSAAIQKWRRPGSCPLVGVWRAFAVIYGLVWISWLMVCYVFLFLLNMRIISDYSFLSPPPSIRSSGNALMLWWGYWELQIINYCLQLINVLHCVIYVTSCHTDTECGKFVGFTPQSFAQWRRWRVKLTIELLVTGARLMAPRLLKKFPIFIEFKVHFPVHNIQCQLALSGYPYWGFSVLFHQL